MTDCTNSNIGRMLHDYELGLLNADDRNQFELHLYDCDHCAYQVREFMEASRIIRTDQEARKLVADASQTSPKTRKIYLRLLMAAVLVLVVVVPVYKLGMFDDIGEINQTLELRPTRSGGADVIYLDRGGAARIKFQVNDTFRGEANVVLTRFEGDTVRYVPEYSDFAEDGFGELVLPLSDFQDGHYILIVSPVSRADSVPDLQYMFRVK